MSNPFYQFQMTNCYWTDGVTTHSNRLGDCNEKALLRRFYVNFSNHLMQFCCVSYIICSIYSCEIIILQICVLSKIKKNIMKSKWNSRTNWKCYTIHKNFANTYWNIPRNQLKCNSMDKIFCWLDNYKICRMLQMIIIIINKMNVCVHKIYLFFHFYFLDVFYLMRYDADFGGKADDQIFNTKTLCIRWHYQSDLMFVLMKIPQFRSSYNYNYFMYRDF